jgi:hypothetical protein
MFPSRRFIPLQRSAQQLCRCPQGVPKNLERKEPGGGQPLSDNVVHGDAPRGRAEEPQDQVARLEVAGGASRRQRGKDGGGVGNERSRFLALKALNGLRCKGANSKARAARRRDSPG